MSTNGMASQSMEEFLHSMMADSPADERLQVFEERERQIDSHDHPYYAGSREHFDSLAKERPWLAEFIKNKGQKAYDLFADPIERYGMVTAKTLEDVYRDTSVSDNFFNRLFNFKRYKFNLMSKIAVGLALFIGLLPFIATGELSFENFLICGIAAPFTLTILRLLGADIQRGPILKYSSIKELVNAKYKGNWETVKIFVKQNKAYISFNQANTFLINYDDEGELSFTPSEEKPEVEIIDFNHSKIIQEPMAQN